MKRTITLGVAGLAAAASLTGCGGSDTAPICSSVDTLKSSMDKVNDVDLTAQGGAAALKSAVNDVKPDLQQVKTDAKAEFSSDVETVQGGYQTLLESVQALADDPATSSVSKVQAELQTLNEDVAKLVSDVQETC